MAHGETMRFGDEPKNDFCTLWPEAALEFAQNMNEIIDDEDD